MQEVCTATELLGLGGLILTQRGKIGLHTALIDCDYFDWLAGDPAAASAYQGICMEQYSWAEDTNAMLYGKQQANDEA